MATEVIQQCIVSTAMSDKLYFTRRSLGLTQLELAQAAGTTNQTISRLEIGLKKNAPVSLIEDIEKALGVEPGAILSLEHSPVSMAVRPGKRKHGKSPAKEVPAKKGFCRHCGELLYEDSNFCQVCGTRTLSAGCCQHCGSPLYTDSVFCTKCGAHV